MSKLTVLFVGLCLVALFTAAAVSAFAGPIRYNQVGTVKLIFLDGGSFAARGGTTDAGAPAYQDDPLSAANALSGSAYYFPGPPSAPPADQRDWWAEYRIAVASLPAGFFADGGTWGFWARTTSASAVQTSVDSDWLVAAGDPGDFPSGNPTSDAEWLAAINTSYVVDGQPYQRVLNNIQLDVSPPLINRTFGWFSEGYGTTFPVVRTRVLYAIGGDVAFRIYEREAAPENSQIDVICWTSDSTYVPTDNDYLGAKAVPEPSSLLALLGGVSGLLAFAKRRRS